MILTRRWLEMLALTAVLALTGHHARIAQSPMPMTMRLWWQPLQKLLPLTEVVRLQSQATMTAAAAVRTMP